MKISEFNFGEYDARREFLRAEKYFLDSFVDPNSFPLSTLNNRSNYIIIGQKGAGKTACQLYLEVEKARTSGYINDLISFFDDLSAEDYRDFAKTQKINLIELDKATDFATLYDFKEVWKRILFIRIAKVLKGNGFSNLYIDYCISSIAGTNSIIDGIKKSLKVEIKIPLSLLETKVKFDPSKIERNEISLLEFNHIALELLKTECRQYRMYFFVDELVISTLNTKSDEYKARIALIRDIVRTCCSMNDYCVKHDLDFHFICNLRPEIRSRLNELDPEISKIMDGNDVFLSWDDASLLEILGQKIVRGAPAGVEVDAKTFIPESITFGSYKQDFVQFLLNNTWYKPRDIVRFLKVYSKINPNDESITEEGVKRSLNEYARISAVEIFEQMSVRHSQAVIEGIRNGIKQRNYKDGDELIKALQPHIQEVVANKFLEELFELGVIGNVDGVRSSRRYFWGHRQEEHFDPDMGVTVHPGLLNYFNVRHR
jgi:hypothetical protein